MTNKSTKRALLASVMAMILCFTMLIGTTFAWFTDSVTTSGNKIVAGTLNIDLVDAEGKSLEGEMIEWVTSDNRAQDKILWEPGCTYNTEEFYIENKGDLNLKFQFKVTGIDGDAKLLEVVDFSCMADASWFKFNTGAVSVNTSGEFDLLEGYTVDTIFYGEQTFNEYVLEPGQKVGPIVLTGHMDENAGNEYQGLTIEGISVSLVATQATGEEDSFNGVYDEDAVMPWNGDVNTEWTGSGTATDPYVLSSAADFAGLAQIVAGNPMARSAGNTCKGEYFTLSSDVDLAGIEWTPIGNSTTKFEGHFDGQGHTISNLVIDSVGSSNVGLFGFTQNGSVKNFTVNNATVIGRLNVGVVAGTPYTSTFDNIEITGTVKVEGMAYVGGVLGKNAYANVSNITVDVTNDSYVKANSIENGTAYRTYVGGVIGFMGEGGHTVSNVTSNIDVFGTTCDVGGIAGIAHYGNSFVNCSSSGNVTITDAAEAGDAEELGGIAGVWHNKDGTDVTFDGCSFTGTLNANITEGVDLSDNTITGKAYSENGSGNLVIK